MISHLPEEKFRAPHPADKLLQQDKNKGAKIAKLDDLVIDDAGAIRYAFLSYGGLSSLNEQHMLVSWLALRISPDPAIISLDINTDELKRAPPIDRAEWRTSQASTGTMSTAIILGAVLDNWLGIDQECRMAGCGKVD